MHSTDLMDEDGGSRRVIFVFRREDVISLDCQSHSPLCLDLDPCLHGGPVTMYITHSDSSSAIMMT